MKYSDEQCIRNIYEYAFKLQEYIRKSAYCNKVSNDKFNSTL